MDNHPANKAGAERDPRALNHDSGTFALPSEG